tara:strand:- start:25 stop:441 length:417 start_codon:yes stop_codon:yes gene_type:complete
MRWNLVFFTITFFVLTLGCSEKKQNSEKEKEKPLASLPKGTLPEDPLVLPAGSNLEANMHNKEGISHYNEGHYDVALKHFQQAEKSDPSIGEIHFNEALALDQIGDHGAATNHFKVARDGAKGNEKILTSEILIKHIQ